jgi:hypothetical protein
MMSGRFSLAGLKVIFARALFDHPGLVKPEEN